MVDVKEGQQGMEEMQMEAPPRKNSGAFWVVVLIILILAGVGVGVYYLVNNIGKTTDTEQGSVVSATATAGASKTATKTSTVSVTPTANASTTPTTTATATPVGQL